MLDDYLGPYLMETLESPDFVPMSWYKDDDTLASDNINTETPSVEEGGGHPAKSDD